MKSHSITKSVIPVKDIVVIQCKRIRASELVLLDIFHIDSEIWVARTVDYVHLGRKDDEDPGR